ncbi:hypothetical protein HC891_01700 [Candidatus Gracilibacteria bacterium]|nr:hypothetical protein [Candidatus Gracilibacteria bacterium]
MPTRPNASAAPRDDIPAWLREDDTPLTPPQAPVAATTPPPAEDVPDWLRDLQSELDQRADDGTASRAGAGGDVPDWLRETDDLIDPNQPQRQGRMSGATSWLDKMGDPEQPLTPSTPTAPESSTTTNSRIKMPVGATDWLRSIGEEADPSAPAAARAEPEPSSGDEVPAWLRDVSPDELQDQIAASDSEHGLDVPSWLLDGADRRVPPAQAAASSAESDVDLPVLDAVPDWLGELTRDEKPRSNPPSWLSADDTGDGAGADDAVPDWLRDVVDETPAARQLSAVDDVPAWLRDEVVGTQEPRGAVGQPTDDARKAAPVDAEVPTWLRDSAVPFDATQDNVSAPPAAEIPSWLQDAEPTPTAREGEIPAWLQGMDDEAAAPLAASIQEPQLPVSADAQAQGARLLMFRPGCLAIKHRQAHPMSAYRRGCAASMRSRYRHDRHQHGRQLPVQV